MSAHASTSTSGAVSAGATRWVRATSVLWRYVPGGVLLLGPYSPHPFLVSGSGASVWQLLAEPVEEDEMIEALARACGVATGVVAADLRPLLDDLAARELVIRLP